MKGWLTARYHNGLKPALTFMKKVQYFTDMTVTYRLFHCLFGDQRFVVAEWTGKVAALGKDHGCNLARVIGQGKRDESPDMKIHKYVILEQKTSFLFQTPPACRHSTGLLGAGIQPHGSKPRCFDRSPGTRAAPPLCSRDPGRWKRMA